MTCPHHGEITGLSRCPECFAEVAVEVMNALCPLIGDLERAAWSRRWKDLKAARKAIEQQYGVPLTYQRIFEAPR